MPKSSKHLLHWLGPGFFAVLILSLFSISVQAQQREIELEDRESIEVVDDDPNHFPKSMFSLGVFHSRYRTFANQLSLSAPFAIDLHFTHLFSEGEQIVNLDFYFTPLESIYVDHQHLEYSVFPITADLNVGKSMTSWLYQKVRPFRLLDLAEQENTYGKKRVVRKTKFLTKGKRHIYLRSGALFNQYTDVRERQVGNNTVELHSVQSFSVYAGGSWMAVGMLKYSGAHLIQPKRFWSMELYGDLSYAPVLNALGIHRETQEDGVVFEVGRMREGARAFQRNRLGGRVGTVFQNSGEITTLNFRVYGELALLPGFSTYYSQLALGVCVIFPGY